MAGYITIINYTEDRVIEECSELIKAIAKAHRFGYMNWHPDHPTRRNWTDILLEINDVREQCDYLEKSLRKEFSLT
jgi:hypothetical protein